MSGAGDLWPCSVRPPGTAYRPTYRPGSKCSSRRLQMAGSLRFGTVWLYKRPSFPTIWARAINRVHRVRTGSWIFFGYDFLFFGCFWSKFGSGTPPRCSRTINSIGFRPSFIQFRLIFEKFDQISIQKQIRKKLCAGQCFDHQQTRNCHIYIYIYERS